jgi:hypothetical protein
MKALNNSERRNTCDTLWAHFTNLSDCPSVSGGSCASWNATWKDLKCWTNTSNGAYLIEKVSNGENYVKQAGTKLC